ncbi:hypothetical protein ACMZ5F_14030 [Streptomyces rhizosphaericola]|uniref:hypothetical protein n=1 Tax=Streptomyces rhizosphaericola TaxID=2564098 RepID=UPI0039F087F3
MGIESDQLVYDYLSRVGDLAQQHQLSSGARMRLVSTLRVEIDRQRAREGADSPAAVRRIIGRLGAPDELVGAAAESGDGEVPLPSARTGSGAGARTGSGAGSGAAVPRPRIGFLRKGPKTSAAPEAVGAPDASDGPDTPTGRGSAPDGSPGRDRAQAPDEPPATPWPHPSAPHVLGPDQQSTGDGGADWWRLEPGPFDAGTAVPGFLGGIEAPELLGRRPAEPAAEDKEADKKQAGKEDADKKDAGKKGAGRKDAGRKETGAAAGGKDDGAPGTEDGGDGGAAPRRALRIPVPRPRRRKPAPASVAAPAAVAAAPRGGFAHPLLLLAALLLIAGVVTGSWIPLAGGWLIAYGSRTLSRTEAKWAALGLPGVVVAGALVWVWGRLDGRWGEPIEEGALREVLTGAWPVVVRVAAVASALYLVWRARRRA